MVGIKSDAGNVRELNEDYASFIEDERFKIYLVADGMVDIMPEKLPAS